MNFHNRHYIRIDSNSFIVQGFSDAFPEIYGEILETDICVNEEGGRHYNPQLRTIQGAPKYKWVGQMVETTTEEQSAWIELHKTPEVKIAELKVKLAETDYAIIKMAEGAATAADYADLISQRQAWREEINQLGG